MPNQRGTIAFKLFGVPIQIQPIFWLIAVLFSPFFSLHRGNGDSRILLIGLIAWVTAWLLSFLVHEMGHALAVGRLFGANPRIVLYGFGGVTLYQPYYKRFPGWSGRLLISFAGPGAEIAAALLLAGGFALFGVPISFGIDQFGPLQIPSINVGILEMGESVSLSAYFALYAVSVFVNAFVWMGLFWGILNLLPIYPLDGGHIARELTAKFFPRNGIRISLIISMILTISLAGYALAERQFFIAIFFGLFARMNWSELKDIS